MTVNENLVQMKALHNKKAFAHNLKDGQTTTNLLAKDWAFTRFSCFKTLYLALRTYLDK